ncbi:unnamed protein product [Fraxinus pennsylvanica]|uniref:LysM domain-containing protein n=1 Tax=Fraxinus pennsylvanica TaxID=56036 RepID=A0AAD2AB28_9LAMI|nr:unnamed protein product [Fraxinus pennsylvanica]
MGLKVQLRNLFCNYEMVGSSMLGLIQVERFYSPLQREQDGAEYDQDEQLIQERINFENEIHENHVPQFKTSDVHLTGLNVELVDKQLWGTRRQNQSGSGWLFSSGMNSTNELSISISNAIVKSSAQITRKVCPGDVLWSIASNIHGDSATWDEAVALNIYARNPDIIFPNELLGSRSSREKRNFWWTIEAFLLAETRRFALHPILRVC